MSEPQRLLDGAPSSLARLLLEAGLAERPAKDARARAWRACAGEGLRTGSTFDGSARSFAETISKTLQLARLPRWLRRGAGFGAIAALATVCAFSIWVWHERSRPASTHYSRAPESGDESAHLDRVQLLLERRDAKAARHALARYRSQFPDGRLRARADLLELHAQALSQPNSMDTP